MFTGCPTFNIPVPTPQLQQPYKPQQQQQTHQQQQTPQHQQYYQEPREQQPFSPQQQQHQQQQYQFDQKQQLPFDQPQQFDQQLQQQFVHPELQNHLDQYQQQYDQQQQQQQPSSDERNFLERASQQLVSTFKSFGENFLKSGKNGSGGVETNRLAEKKGDVDGSSKQNFLPMMVAGAAAVALGGLALFGTQPSVATVNSAKNELVYQDRSGRAEKILDALSEAKDIYKEDE